MASSPFCDFLSLGAGVTPAEGSVKPTAGFTFNKVTYSPPFASALSPGAFLNSIFAAFAIFFSSALTTAS